MLAARASAILTGVSKFNGDGVLTLWARDESLLRHDG
jgi:hypothetical protein